MLHRQEQSHRALNHSRSDSILSRSAAEGLLHGLSTPHASEFHYSSSSSQHSRNTSSSTYRPPRPARSPSAPHRRVVSNPPPLPTTLPTRTRVVPLIPGLGFHLAQRRAAKATSNPLSPLSGGVNNSFEISSPSSNYSHSAESSSSDSDGCPPTESDRPDSVAPTPAVTEPWRESDNYQSPVWASRWSRRGSESSGTGTAGSRGTGAGTEPLNRRPSFSTFSAGRRRDSFDFGQEAGPSRSRDSSIDPMSRRPSASSLRHDTSIQYLGGGPRGPARRTSNASNAHPNFLFPFPGGGRHEGKASSFDSRNGFGGGGSSSIPRRDSSVSIRYSENGDAWDDLQNPDSADLSRRSSYDSTFAFDRGRAASFSYSPTNNSFLGTKRRTSQESFGSLAGSRANGFRRNSPYGSLRDLAHLPTSLGFRSGGSSISGGAGGLGIERRESWRSQTGLMISGGRMERNLSVDSGGEIERIRRLRGMRELTRRESEVLEMGWTMLDRRYESEDDENPWGASLEPGISHWSPSTAPSPSSVVPGQHDDASSPEIADSSSSSSSPTSPIYLQNHRSRHLEPAGTYEERASSDASPPEALSALPPLPSDPLTPRRMGHQPQISLTFSFEDSAKRSPPPSFDARDLSDLSPELLSPLTLDPKASRRVSTSPGRLLAAMLADQGGEGTSESGSEFDEDPTRDVEFAVARRGALSPVVLHNGKEFPMSSTAPLLLPQRPNGPVSTPSNGSSDLDYLAQSIRIFSDSEEDNLDSLADSALPSPPFLLPSLFIRPTLRNSHSMSALPNRRTYDRMAAFNKTKEPSSGWSSSPFAAQPVPNPSVNKTSYIGPSSPPSSSSSLGGVEEDTKDITPRGPRRRPNCPRAATHNVASTSSAPRWEAPWSASVHNGPIPLVYDKTPPMQVVGRSGQQQRRDAVSSSLSPTAHFFASKSRRASTNPPMPPIPILSTKRSTASLPFERAFVQRAKEERTRSDGGSFASSSSSSNQSSSQQQQCTGSAIHPDSGLCYCGTAYLSSQRMSKPSTRILAPHLPPPHLRLGTAPINIIDEDHSYDKNTIRLSMPAPLADLEVLPKIPSRSVPLPESTSSSRLGGPRKVLSRFFATHRKTASSGTF